MKALKRGALAALRRAGVFRATRDSAWRRNRLLILCYHGISIDDEHEWDAAYYMTAEAFERRLRLLRDGSYTVLTLSDAVSRLYAGTLPPRSVVLTFDDGLADFGIRAMPLLRKYGFPATVYLSTYYVLDNKPVFPTFLSYLLWKARWRTLDVSDVAPGAWPQRWTLGDPDQRRRAAEALRAYAEERGWDAEQKDAMLRQLAAVAGVNYDGLVARRILHLLTPEEVRALAAEGIDFQLHTHRHRTPLDRDLFVGEITRNREHVRALVGSTPRHFCYPSGVYRPEFLGWLDETGVISATTCDTGIASPRSRALLLPRVIDTSTLTELEVESWLTGVGALLPRRPNRAGQW